MIDHTGINVSNIDLRPALIDPLASNTRAHRFYERLGFQCIDRRWFGEDDCFVYRLNRSDWCQTESNSPIAT